jgi:hypothetical protein
VVEGFLIITYDEYRDFRNANCQYISRIIGDCHQFLRIIGDCHQFLYFVNFSISKFLISVTNFSGHQFLNQFLSHQFLVTNFSPISPRGHHSPRWQEPEPGTGEGPAGLALQEIQQGHGPGRAGKGSTVGEARTVAGPELRSAVGLAEKASVPVNDLSPT